MGQIFLSHVAEDGVPAQALAAGLEREGYSTWYYERDAVPGVEHMKQTREAIQQAESVAVLISPNSLANPRYVWPEVRRAVMGQKPFMPLLLEVAWDRVETDYPDWDDALGGAVAIRVPPEHPAEALPKVIAGLQRLGIQPERRREVLGGGERQTTRPLARLFVSYRREDIASQKMYQLLAGRFEVQVGMSRPTVRPGAWSRVIADEIDQCDVFVLVIGNGWQDGRDQDGNRRIDDPNDTHRQEIEAALEARVKVLPVLMDDAEVPRREGLPETLRGLPDIPMVRVAPSNTTIEELFGAIETMATRGSEGAGIEVRQADIRMLRVDAITSSADTRLQGTVAAAIIRAGGPMVEEEVEAAAPIGPGEVVATTGGEMPARWVIHAATLPPSAEVIRAAVRSTLRKADELGAKSLALLAFGTGGGGFPLDEAAQIEVGEVRRYVEDRGSLERIVFAVNTKTAREIFEKAVTEAGL